MLNLNNNFSGKQQKEDIGIGGLSGLGGPEMVFDPDANLGASREPRCDDQTSHQYRHDRGTNRGPMFANGAAMGVTDCFSARSRSDLLVSGDELDDRGYRGRDYQPYREPSETRLNGGDTFVDTVSGLITGDGFRGFRDPIERSDRSGQFLPDEGNRVDTELVRDPDTGRVQRKRR